MKKLLLILTIFFSLYSSGQSPMFKLIAKRAVAVSCSYPLDDYTGAEAAFSLRKIGSAYAGSAIRVRRSSDNTEQDIGFTGCNLDTSTLKTFVGTGGTDDGFIVTWYDQSGNTFDVTQATSGTQPKIMGNGVIYRLGGLPFAYFEGSRYLERANIMSAASSATLIMVAKNDADPPSCNTCGTALELIGNNNASHFPYSDGVVYDGFASQTRKTTGNPTASLASKFLLFTTSAASDWKMYINNSLHYSTATNVYTSNSNLIVGASRFYTFSYKGYISEIILYDSNKESDRSGISSSINSYYSIY